MQVAAQGLESLSPRKIGEVATRAFSPVFDMIYNVNTPLIVFVCEHVEGKNLLINLFIVEHVE